MTINRGIGDVDGKDSRKLSPTTSTTYTLTARNCGAETTKTETVSVYPKVPAVARVSPSSGSVLRIIPREVTFTWKKPQYGYGLTFGIEVQAASGGKWSKLVAKSGLSGTSYELPALSSDKQLRWRVWAIGPRSIEGPRGDWWTVTFRTSAKQYDGTWYNEAGPSVGLGILNKIAIKSMGQILYVHPYMDYPGGDLGIRIRVFSGEPIRVDFGNLDFTIRMANTAGTRLRIEWHSEDTGDVQWEHFRK